MAKKQKIVSKKRLREILPFLQTFKELRPTQRCILIAHIDDVSCEVLCETICNVLKNPKVASKQRTKLKRLLQPHKNSLRALSTPSTSKSVKKKKLHQLGGFPLSALLSTAIPLLLSRLTRNNGLV